MYPMMQGYDSVAINSDIELGGTDQKFNVLRGRDLQIFEGMEPQIGMFMPILLGTDGKVKMSKSIGNYVGLNEPADVMYHKIYSLADSLIENWFELLTEVPLEEVRQMTLAIANGKMNPNEAKHRLAIDIVTQYYGAEAAEAAAQKEREVHSGSAIPGDAKEVSLASGEKQVLDLLVEIGAFKSKGEARRMVQNGGVKLRLKYADSVSIADVVCTGASEKFKSIDEEWAEWKVDDAMAILKVPASAMIVVQIGKRNYFKVNFQ